MIEIEFLAAKKPVNIKSKSNDNDQDAYACHIVHMLYRTRPAMSYQQEGYQRGPIHVGKLEINFRAYGWSQKQMDQFVALRADQELEVLKSVSDSVKTAMESLGDDLKGYLKEAGEEFAEDKRPAADKKKAPTMWQQIKADFVGPSALEPKKKGKKPKSAKEQAVGKAKQKGAIKSAGKAAQNDLYLSFKNFKKAHGMVMW